MGLACELMRTLKTTNGILLDFPFLPQQYYAQNTFFKTFLYIPPATQDKFDNTCLKPHNLRSRGVKWPCSRHSIISSSYVTHILTIDNFKI